jgi:hypothetical protein
LAKLTQERLKELLYYDPESGDFTWLVSTTNSVKIGDKAGGVNSRGYLLIRIDTLLYSAHHLAVLYVKGVWPKDLVDHKDTDRLNNSWGNLRECEPFQNRMNRKCNANSSSGVKGVSSGKGRKTFKVVIDKKYYGSFKDIESATEAAMKIRENLHGEFANHG